MYILYMYTCHSWNYLGDWITPHGSEESGSEEADLFNNNYMLYCTRLLAQISTVLGNHTAAAAYSAAAQAHADSIHRRWFVPATGGYLDSKQTHLVLPLVSGAVPAEEVARVRANLAQQILSTQVRIVCLCMCRDVNMRMCVCLYGVCVCVCVCVLGSDRYRKVAKQIHASISTEWSCGHGSSRDILHV